MTKGITGNYGAERVKTPASTLCIQTVKTNKKIDLRSLNNVLWRILRVGSLHEAEFFISLFTVDPPRITQHPKDQLVFIGTDIILNVGAIGEGKKEWEGNMLRQPLESNFLLCSYFLHIFNANFYNHMCLFFLDITVTFLVCRRPMWFWDLCRDKFCCHQQPLSQLWMAKIWPQATHSWRRNASTTHRMQSCYQSMSHWTVQYPRWFTAC